MCGHSPESNADDTRNPAGNNESRGIANEGSGSRALHSQTAGRLLVTFIMSARQIIVKTSRWWPSVDWAAGRRAGCSGEGGGKIPVN